jgi:serine/threonine protein kinase
VEHVHALTKGARLNQYEVESILGAGGFGITYMARDTSLDTLVAIKEYLPGDFAVRQGDSQVTAKSSTSKGDFDWGLTRFLDEARVLAKFRHPNIVRVNQIFEANHTAYLVMEYVKGQSLDDMLKQVGQLSEQQTKDILFPILDGLKRVHELGFLHRDIKPANILIREEGDAVLIDFGAARQALETRKQGLTSIYTEGYAPLEQYDTTGNQGPWTDVYALGGVAYKCVTGKKPPSATSRLRNDPLVPTGIAANGRISPQFAAAIDAALQVDERKRPQTIAEFAAIISGAVPVNDDATRLARPDDEATRMSQPLAFQPSSLPQRTVSQSSPSVSNPASTRPESLRAPAPARGMKPVFIGAAAVVVIVLVPAMAWFYLHSASPSPQVAAITPPPAITPAVPAAPAPVVAPAVPNAAPPPPVAEPATPAASAPPPKQAAEAQPAPKPATAPKPAEAPIIANNAGSQTAGAPPRPPAIHASFDCAKPGNDAEHLICSDKQLADLDVKMAYLYELGLSSVIDKNEFSGEQISWLPRRNGCSDKECLVTAYNDRIKELERWVRR